MALNIEHKEENEGKNSRGRLSAEEFNNLIDTVKELEKNANTPSSIGELKNVSPESDTAEDGSVLLYGNNGWSPAAGVFIPTGVAEDGSIITTFEDLMNYISSHSGGGGETGIQRNLRIINNLDSKSLSASKGEPCHLNFTFISQERYSTNEPYEDTGERGFCQISV